jgi:hypothetical protein
VIPIDDTFNFARDEECSHVFSFKNHLMNSIGCRGLRRGHKDNYSAFRPNSLQTSIAQRCAFCQ